MGKNIWFIILLTVFLSLIAAAQWIPLTTSFGSDIRSMTKTNNAIVVGTNGNGVFISTNAGLSWSNKNNGLTNLKIYSLATNGTHIAAGTYGGGVYISTDGGENWVQKNSGLSLPYINALGYSGGNIMAGTGGGGTFVSTNSGTNWSTSLTTTFIVNTFFVTDTVIYSGVGPYFYRSTNNGSTWILKNAAVWTIKAFAMTSRIGGGANIFVGTLDGMIHTGDNGVQWANINTGLSYRNVNALAVNGTIVFAATENGGVFFTKDEGKNWSAFNTGLPQNSNIRAFITDENFAYAATSEGIVWKRALSETITSIVNNNDGNPVKYSLAQNFPNPFNPVTSIIFSMKNSGFASLKVFNSLGEEIAHLINGELSSGMHTIRFDASSLAGGSYFYQLRYNDAMITKKMMLIK